MSLRTRSVALACCVLTVAAMGLVTAGTASASTPAAQSQELTVTDPSTGCTEVFTVSEYLSTPIFGPDQYIVDAQFTKNPCGLTNGLEAGLELTDPEPPGYTAKSYGNDVHKVGDVSEVDGDASMFYCVKYGARWWNGSSWDYHWYTGC